MVNDGDVQIGGVDLSKMDDCVAVCEYLAEHGRDNPDVNLLLFHGKLDLSVAKHMMTLM